MSTRAFATIAVVCLLASAALLVLAKLAGSAGLGVAGLVPLLVLGAAKWWWWTD
ncbi:MAG: hypothetical protein ACJ76L_03515 [Conexibacter sp.]